VGHIELDSHADTTVLGKNFKVMSYTGQECEVFPYNDSYESIKHVPIVTGATAWTSPMDCQTYVLVFNQSLWMGDQMDDSLVNPNQLRHFNLNVQDNPFHESPLMISSVQDEFLMPLFLHGSNVVADTRVPTEEELQTCQHITMTSPHTWDPQRLQCPKPRYSVEEEMERMGIGRIDTSARHDSSNGQVLYSLDNVQRCLISSVASKDVRINAVVNDNVATDTAVRVEVPTDVNLPQTFVSKERHSTVTAQELCDRWFGAGQGHIEGYNAEACEVCTPSTGKEVQGRQDI